MAQNLPPVPMNTPLVNDKYIAAPVWADFFKQLFTRVGGSAGTSDDWSVSKAASGYQKLPSGLVIQWGETSSLLSGSTNTISFPMAFETSCLQVMPGLKSMGGASTSDTGHFGTGAYSKTGFEIYNRTASAYVFNWIAIGY